VLFIIGSSFFFLLSVMCSSLSWSLCCDHVFFSVWLDELSFPIDDLIKRNVKRRRRRRKRKKKYDF